MLEIVERFMFCLCLGHAVSGYWGLVVCLWVCKETALLYVWLHVWWRHCMFCSMCNNTTVCLVLCATTPLYGWFCIAGVLPSVVWVYLCTRSWAMTSCILNWRRLSTLFYLHSRYIHSLYLFFLSFPFCRSNAGHSSLRSMLLLFFSIAHCCYLFSPLFFFLSCRS